MSSTAAALATTARSVPFRLLVAATIIVAQLWVMISFGHDRFGIDFNQHPHSPPVFAAPAYEQVSHNWDRFVVSRWDSAHYISLVLRGYSECPKQDVRGLSILPGQCNLNFYPGYAALGWLIQAPTHLAADTSLLALSLVAAFLFLFLWTDPSIMNALGVGPTYAALAAFAVFPNSFAIVAIQTEACTLLFTLAAFLALSKRHVWLAAFFAGAASGMRISGAATGAALGVAILYQLLRDRPKSIAAWVNPLAASLFSGWGLIAIMSYHWWRFRDPLLYIHAHAQTYGHTGSLSALADLKTEWLLRSMDHPLHEGVVVAFAVVWFLLGHKLAMSGFSAQEKVFWYALTILGTGISVVGSIELALAGMNRYLLLIFPLFFAIGSFGIRRPPLFIFWLVLSFWHSRQVDLCDYIGGLGEQRFAKCYVPQWVGHW
jgi:hypothetical protein